MLKKLSIQNYALIDKLEMELDDGFTIITGETGAGKSILLGALSLILGQRADATTLKNKENKCIVEGIFTITKYDLKNFFSENELDHDEVTIIRREITSSGKSRAFINDTPVNLQTLKDLTGMLVDIHSQHENLSLNDHLFQLNVLDTLLGDKLLLDNYKAAYEDYKVKKRTLNELLELEEKTKADSEYLQFQFDELDKAKLVSGEDKDLEEEQQELSHAEEIKSSLLKVIELLSGEEISVLNQLKDADNTLNRLASIYSKAEEAEKRLNQSYIELKDLNDELINLQETVDLDPGRLEHVNTRVDLIFTLCQKHKVNTVDELIEIKNELDQKLLDIASYDERIEKARKDLNECETKLSSLANDLSLGRRGIIPGIEEAVTDLMKQLGIPNARFSIRVKKLDDFTSHGRDMISFLFSANKQSDLNEISKVASGGEISRLMLAIKSLLSTSASLPSIIFDEIDTGVSGEVADKMGIILKQMGGNMQVLNITHLPQVAGRGDHHYLVYKMDEDRQTITRIKKLNNDERVTEIAKMLSGEKLTDAAITNAKELLRG